MERIKILNRLGLRVIRFNNDKIINDLNSVLEEIWKEFKLVEN